MAVLKKEMISLGFKNVETLLNSGNVIFESSGAEDENWEALISSHLEKTAGFPVPVMVRKPALILDLVQNNPFKGINLTESIRLYFSFLKERPGTVPKLPWKSADDSYEILEIRDNTVCSVLDVAVTGTPKGMDELENIFGKNITTRNWNTIKKIADKL